MIELWFLYYYNVTIMILPRVLGDAAWVWARYSWCSRAACFSASILYAGICCLLASGQDLLSKAWSSHKGSGNPRDSATGRSWWAKFRQGSPAVCLGFPHLWKTRELAKMLADYSFGVEAQESSQQRLRVCTSTLKSRRAIVFASSLQGGGEGMVVRIRTPKSPY